MKKILITGDRKWSNYSCMFLFFRQLKDVAIVHGAAPGADSMADDLAKYFKLTCYPVPAEWGTINNKAEGVLRNQKMLDDNPDIKEVYAFHKDIHSSKGTKDMVTRALKKGLPVYLLDGKNTWQITMQKDQKVLLLENVK